jgi:hypothetical protein
LRVKRPNHSKGKPVPWNPNRPRPKYGNKKTEVDGVTFDSKKEANRYSQLKLLLLAGVIAELECQPGFDLVVNGKKVCKYVADFRYRDVATGKVVVEDAKGFKTDVYKIKKRLLFALLGIEVVEV